MAVRISRLPVIGPAVVNVKARADRRRFPGSVGFWEQHYATGGLSGPGSYGQLAEFKAEVLNGFVRDEEIRSVVEFGCGDGNQLTLADYPSYVGLDVSATAIQICNERFAQDPTKRFLLYDPDKPQLEVSADLALSLDVLYHLVEDGVFERYLQDLFQSADRFVGIYSSDIEVPSTAAYVKHRAFTPWVSRHLPRWELFRVVENPSRYSGDASTGSHADFRFFRRTR